MFVVATNDEAGEFADIDDHDASVVGAWASNKQARRGDLVLMYCVAPRSALVSVYEVREDAHFDPFGGWSDHRAKIGGKVAIPWVTYKEMKADPVLKKWSLVRGRFQGMLRYEVPGEVWARCWN